MSQGSIDQPKKPGLFNIWGKDIKKLEITTEDVEIMLEYVRTPDHVKVSDRQCGSGPAMNKLSENAKPLFENVLENTSTLEDNFFSFWKSPDIKNIEDAEEVKLKLLKAANKMKQSFRQDNPSLTEMEISLTFTNFNNFISEVVSDVCS